MSNGKPAGLDRELAAVTREHANLMKAIQEAGRVRDELLTLEKLCCAGMTAR